MRLKKNEQNTSRDTKNPTSDTANSIPKQARKFVFSGNYGDLLTLDFASRITRLAPTNAKKLNTSKGMLGEVLRYYWDNGWEGANGNSTPTRKNAKINTPTFVQIKWVDGEADMESFLNFIEPEEHPALVKITDVGETAYWHTQKNQLEVYYNGVSFTLQVDISNEPSINKEKTIALARLIITEKLKY
ncbi:hypothetical protein MWU59_13840 [Flavobacteriaceae bacterium F08102]|nr:hypothetical protein [Flavobacteriaceae bacterium F08102]